MLKKREDVTPLYINASVLVGDKLYFTACNSKWLYEFHIEDGTVLPVIELPCRTVDILKFSDLVSYEGKIWMIPWLESDIMIYDMEQNTVEWLQLSFPFDRHSAYAAFRKPVQQDNILWLISYFDKLVLRIDMEEVSCKIYKKWAQDVTFDAEVSSVDFKCMYGEGDTIYVFADGCRSNLIIHTETCGIETQRSEGHHPYGVVADGRVYLSPIKNFDHLLYFAMTQKDKEETEIHKITLPDSIWADKSECAYWHGKVIDGEIYFLPHSAKAILIVDIASDKVKAVPLDIKEYQTAMDYKEFAAYDAIPYKEGVIITAFAGNKILLERDGRIVKEYTITKPEVQESGKEQVIIDYILEKGMIRWSQMECDLEDKDAEIEAGRIGQSIYRTLTERKI